MSFPNFPIPPLDDSPLRQGHEVPAPPSFLDLVQGNILKGHGRDRMRLVYFKFGDPVRGRNLLPASVAGAQPWVTSASHQVMQISLHKAYVQNWFQAEILKHGAAELALRGERAHFLSLDDGVRLAPVVPPQPLLPPPDPEETVFGSLMLTAAGMRALGLLPPDRFFQFFAQGMYDRMTPPGLDADLRADWQAPYLGDAIHGLFVLACTNETTLEARTLALAPWCRQFDVTVLDQFVESGTTWRGPSLYDPTGPTRSERGLPREPFGYADGISVSRFFRSQRSLGAPPSGMPTAWDWIDLQLPDVFIRPEDSATHAGGSFLAFVKYEQDVAAFRTYEASLAAALVRDAGLDPVSAARMAEALLVGRTRFGAPMIQVLVHIARSQNLEFQRLLPFLPADVARLLDGHGPPDEVVAAMNEFDFASTRAGACPFHAHVRKVNPRVDDPAVDTRGHDGIVARQMVRRGMLWDPQNLLPSAEDAARASRPSWPTGGVGLLFMAYMRDLVGQFETLHHAWAAGENFPPGNPGDRDGVLFGLEKSWSFAGANFNPMARPTKQRGGAYFYVPSIAWLQNPRV